MAKKLNRNIKKYDIVDLLRHYGADHVPTGPGWQRMLCPFHTDTRPSASVNTRANAFRCFVCDLSGDAIDIVVVKEHLSVNDAAEYCAQIVGDAHDTVESKPDRRFTLFG